MLDKSKEKPSIPENLLQREEIAGLGRDGAMACDILMRSYRVIEEMIKTNPKDSIRMAVPETILCGFDQVVTYIFTNSKGYLEAEYINQEDDKSSCSDRSDEMKKN